LTNKGTRRGYRSSIPSSAVERVVSTYHREGGGVYYSEAECLIGDVVVGLRFYDQDGALVIERPLRNGTVHGMVFHWSEGGDSLESVEPFRNGLPHGTARQWDYDGTLLGTYTLHNGTGWDLWRLPGFGELPYLSEAHSMKDGQPHGNEWWLNEDQKSVYIERHWYEGVQHGIERQWNHHGRLRRGYPKYFIRGMQVNKRSYLKACRSDPSLPPFRDVDNRPARTFPTVVARALRA
jgi:hypothetical protein